MRYPNTEHYTSILHNLKFSTMSCGFFFFLMHFHCVFFFCPWCRTQSESWNMSWKMLNMTWAVMWGSTRTFSMSKWHWMLKFIPTGTSLITVFWLYSINRFTVDLIANSQDQQSLHNRSEKKIIISFIIICLCIFSRFQFLILSVVLQMFIQLKYFFSIPLQCKLQFFYLYLEGLVLICHCRSLLAAQSLCDIQN